MSEFSSDGHPEEANELESYHKLIGQLNAWSRERMENIPPRFFEAKARREIVNEAQKDIKLGFKLSKQETRRLLGQIQKQVGILGLSPSQSVSEDRVDSISREPFKATVICNNDGWVAEEIKSDGSVISRAKILTDGSTELTLNFSGQRYSKRNANPNLNADTRFSRATFKTFSLLASTFNSHAS